MKNNNVELKKMDAKSLQALVQKLKREYFDLKLSAATTSVKDNSQFRKLRVSIAQALTHLNEK